MYQCWRLDPTSRFTFKIISDEIFKIIENIYKAENLMKESFKPQKNVVTQNYIGRNISNSLPMSRSCSLRDNSYNPNQFNYFENQMREVCKAGAYSENKEFNHIQETSLGASSWTHVAPNSQLGSPIPSCRMKLGEDTSETRDGSNGDKLMALKRENENENQAGNNKRSLSANRMRNFDKEQTCTGNDNYLSTTTSTTVPKESKGRENPISTRIRNAFSTVLSFSSDIRGQQESSQSSQPPQVPPTEPSGGFISYFNRMLQFPSANSNAGNPKIYNSDEGSDLNLTGNSLENPLLSGSSGFLSSSTSCSESCSSTKQKNSGVFRNFRDENAIKNDDKGKQTELPSGNLPKADKKPSKPVKPSKEAILKKKKSASKLT